MDAAWKEAASAAMDRYACGDDAAFSELHDRLAPRLASFLMRRTRNEAKTDDLVQQTFLQMHCARRHFTTGASVTAWAYAIARRILIDTHRKSGRETLAATADVGEDERASAPCAEMPDRLAASNRLARRLEQELARVPETNRAAFELVHGDGLTAAEAAEVLGTTSMAVRLRVHRASEALRAVLGDQVREELGESMTARRVQSHAPAVCSALHGACANASSSPVRGVERIGASLAFPPSREGRPS